MYGSITHYFWSTGALHKDTTYNMSPLDRMPVHRKATPPPPKKGVLPKDITQ